MAGSHGTLGVLTEVSFKVLPDVEACAVLLIQGLSDADAIQALSVGLGSPFDVTGAAHMPKGADGHPVTLLRLEGFVASVAYRVQELSKLLDRFGDIKVESDPDKTRALWRAVRDVDAFHGQDGDVWRMSVKPTDGPQVAASLPSAQVIYDWGGGLVWALVPPGSDVRSKLGGVSGHATLIRGSVDTRTAQPVFPPEPAALAQITAGIKAKFDPRNILNPGLMA
jgi:glycolate oxidase FAD binding subunit